MNHNSLDFNNLLDEFNTTFNIKKAGETVSLITDEYEEMLAEKPHTANHLKECCDIIYVSAQQLRAMGEDVNTGVENCEELINLHIYLNSGDLAVPTINSVIFSVIGLVESLNYNWQSAFLEVHRSNLSKRVPRDQTEKELLIARDRYPNAFIIELQEYCLLKCADTNKVIKPTCYSEAVMKEEWYLPGK